MRVPDIPERPLEQSDRNAHTLAPNASDSESNITLIRVRAGASARARLDLYQCDHV